MDIYGRWRKGECGNLAGRPKGARNKSTVFKEAVIAHATQKIAADIAAHSGRGEAALRVLAKWKRQQMDGRLAPD